MFGAFVLAVGLAMDATAVAAARSVSGVSRRPLMFLALTFGVAQAAMAALGWLLGASAASWLANWDHWIAFGLLLAIGGKMLYEALRGGHDDAEQAARPLSARMVVVLAIATSIDALAAGVTLPAVGAPPVIALILIGVVTFVLSAVGGLVGGRLGRHLGSKLEIVGGLALIAIGAKTLFDHLSA